MPQPVEISRHAVLAAITRGDSRIREVIESTGLSSTTVRKRLEELERAGKIRVDAHRGRLGSVIHLLDERGRLARRVSQEDPAERRISTSLPVAAVWLKAPLEDQMRVADELRAAGADAVFNCAGDFDLFALYATAGADDALRLARSLSSQDDLKSVHYGIVVGSAGS